MCVKSVSGKSDDRQKQDDQCGRDLFLEAQPEDLRFNCGVGRWLICGHKRLSILREADTIVQSEMEAADWYYKVWQSFAVLLPVRSVGVMGDGRTYEHAVALRAVQTSDFMTAHWAPLPPDLLAKISNRITNEVRGINRVVYDISSKPPATIEWE